MAKPVDIKLRIQAENADSVKKALEGLGVTGQSAMKKLEAAAKAARPETKAMAAAADDLKDQINGLGQDIPGVSAALRGLGPAGTVVAGAFALVTAAVAAGMTAAREYMTWAADLTDAADAVQVNVEALQTWRFAMEEVGGTSKDLDAGLQGLNSTIGAIKTGLGDAKQLGALKELGLDPEVVRSWDSLEEALPAIVKAFENVGDEAARVRIAERLQLKELLPLLRLGSDGFKSVERAATDLGVAVDEHTVKALDEANRRLEISADRMRNEAAPAAVFFANMLAGIGEAAAGALDQVNPLIDSLNRAMRAQRDFKAEQARVASYNPGAADGMGMQALAVAGVPTFAYESGRSLPRRMAKGGRGGGGGGSATIDNVLAENARRNGVFPPSPQPPPRSLTGGSGRVSAGKARAASNVVSKAADAVRERNQRELDRATLDELQATQAMAKSSAERRDIAVKIATTEKDQSLKAIEADKDLDETAKNKKLIAVETAYQAELAQIASEAWDELGQQLEEQKNKDRNSLRLIEDAELSMLESASANATTRAESLAIEMKILDLVVARQLAEIDALKASEDAKDLAKAAVVAAKGAQAKIIERQNQGPLEQYRDNIKRERDNINDALESIAVNGLQSLEDGLMSVIDGTKSVKDAFSDMARSILAELTQLAIRQWIIKPLMDMMGLGGPSSGGGFLSSIFGGGRAMGGPVMAGSSYIVGERGPERFTPMTPGMISPSGGGGVKVTIYNAPTQARVQERPDGGVDIIFERLAAQEQRMNSIDQSIEGRALGAYGDARRRGYI
jgi:hypothetical protein